MAYKVDAISLIFLILGVASVLLSIVAIILSVKKKKPFVLPIIAIGLGIGALVNGIIAFRMHGYSSWECVYEYVEDYGYRCVDEAEVMYYYHHACAWVCLGLGSGAAAVAILGFIISLLPKRAEADEVDEELTGNDFYVEFSQGALRIEGNVITMYRNWLPFTAFKAGRISTVFYMNDIQSITYKGCGWFQGLFKVTLKHPNKPFAFTFGKWWVWRRKRFNKVMKPVYLHLLKCVTENNAEGIK